jgi:hypothetical protein
LGKLAALAISVISNQISVREELSCASKAYGKNWRGACDGAADNSLGWRYKFGPLPNNYCVLQDVAEWSRNQPAMNFISKPLRGPSSPKRLLRASILIGSTA